MNIQETVIQHVVRASIPKSELKLAIVTGLGITGPADHIDANTSLDIECEDGEFVDAITLSLPCVIKEKDALPLHLHPKLTGSKLRKLFGLLLDRSADDVKAVYYAGDTHVMVEFIRDASQSPPAGSNGGDLSDDDIPF